MVPKSGLRVAETTEDGGRFAYLARSLYKHPHTKTHTPTQRAPERWPSFCLGGFMFLPS